MRTIQELPEAIQSAEVSRGSLVRLGASVWPVLGAHTREARLLSAHVPYQEGVIFHGRTAAWIWGTRRHAPTRMEYAVNHSRRVCITSAVPFTRREMTFRDDDVLLERERLITSPLRTAFDLLQLSDDEFSAERATVRLLLVKFGVSRHDVLERLRLSPRTPHSRRLRERVAIL